jgi:hypothetical protein
MFAKVSEVIQRIDYYWGVIGVPSLIVVIRFLYGFFSTRKKATDKLAKVCGYSGTSIKHFKRSLKVYEPHTISDKGGNDIQGIKEFFKAIIGKPFVLILGNSGSGKTLLLQNMAVRVCRYHMKANSLSDYGVVFLTLAKIGSTLKQQLDEVVKRVEQSKSSTCYIMIDGFDELNELGDNEKAAIDLLEYIVAFFRDNQSIRDKLVQIVLSSREEVFKDQYIDYDSLNIEVYFLRRFSIRKILSLHKRNNHQLFGLIPRANRGRLIRHLKTVGEVDGEANSIFSTPFFIQYSDILLSLCSDSQLMAGDIYPAFNTIVLDYWLPREYAAYSKAYIKAPIEQEDYIGKAMSYLSALMEVMIKKNTDFITIRESLESTIIPQGYLSTNSLVTRHLMRKYGEDKLCFIHKSVYTWFLAKYLAHDDVSYSVRLNYVEKESLPDLKSMYLGVICDENKNKLSKSVDGFQVDDLAEFKSEIINKNILKVTFKPRLSIKSLLNYFPWVKKLSFREVTLERQEIMDFLAKSTLDLESQGLFDLDLLEHFGPIVELDISNNEVTCFPVNEATEGICFLNIRNTALSDFSALEKLSLDTIVATVEKEHELEQLLKNIKADKYVFDFKPFSSLYKHAKKDRERGFNIYSWQRHKFKPFVDESATHSDYDEELLVSIYILDSISFKRSSSNIEHMLLTVGNGRFASKEGWEKYWSIEHSNFNLAVRGMNNIPNVEGFRAVDPRYDKNDKDRFYTALRVYQLTRILHIHKGFYHYSRNEYKEAAGHFELGLMIHKWPQERNGNKRLCVEERVSGNITHFYDYIKRYYDIKEVKRLLEECLRRLGKRECIDYSICTINDFTDGTPDTRLGVVYLFDLLLGELSQAGKSAFDRLSNDFTGRTPDTRLGAVNFVKLLLVELSQTDKLIFDRLNADILAELDGEKIMKKLNVSFEGTTDTTGYLFSFAKCLSAALRHSKYADFAYDIIASSGFAFRMWMAPDLCPSATSVWEFRKQKPWVENGGLSCDYVERLWGEDAVEEERRLAAIETIEKSIDNGIAAVAWDISGCEWGLITGYDDNTQTLYTLKISGSEDSIPYEKLGQLELPIMSVLTVTGASSKTQADIIADTKKLAASHLRGEEWCDNVKGLAAYDALIGYIREKYTPDVSWNLEYYLGTYAALKWYAWKFFDKYGETELAGLYKTVYESWKAAFDMKTSCDVSDTQVQSEIISMLTAANEAEKKADELMG